MLNYQDERLPEHMRDGMKLYLERGIEPGSFLEAVLSNDLRAACECADHINQRRLFDIVSWLYNEAPAGSWGSPENFNHWRARQLARQMAST